MLTKCSQKFETKGKTGHHWVTNAMKRKDWPSLDCAHNPKVGGSNPPPAINNLRLKKGARNGPLLASI